MNTKIPKVQIIKSIPIFGVRSLIKGPNKRITEQIQYYEIDIENFASISSEYQGEALCFLFNLIGIRAVSNRELTDEFVSEDIEFSSKNIIEDLKVLNYSFSRYGESEVFGSVKTVEAGNKITDLRIVENLN